MGGSSNPIYSSDAVNLSVFTLPTSSAPAPQPSPPPVEWPLEPLPNEPTPTGIVHDIADPFTVKEPIPNGELIVLDNPYEPSTIKSFGQVMNSEGQQVALFRITMTRDSLAHKYKVGDYHYFEYPIFDQPYSAEALVPPSDVIPFSQYAGDFVVASETTPVDLGTLYRVSVGGETKYVHLPLWEQGATLYTSEGAIELTHGGASSPIPVLDLEYELYDGPIEVIEPREVYDGTIEAVERAGAQPRTWFGISTETPEWLSSIGRGLMSFVARSPQATQTAERVLNVAKVGGKVGGIVVMAGGAAAFVGLELYVYGPRILDGDIEAGAELAGDIAMFGVGCASAPIDVPWTAAYFGTRLVADGFDFGEAWEETEAFSFPISRTAGWLVTEGALFVMDPIPEESIEIDTSMMPSAPEQGPATVGNSDTQV